jgi:hypothetical protein
MVGWLGHLMITTARRIVSLDQLNGDRVAAAELSYSQLGNLGGWGSRSSIAGFQASSIFAHC